MMGRLAIEVGSWRCGLVRSAVRPEAGRRADADCNAEKMINFAV